MHLNPYLFFNGQCETAFKFYEQCLGGKIIARMTYADSPETTMTDQMPPDWHNKIMHMSLKVGDQELMGSDNPMDYKTPQGFFISINQSDPVAAERIFNTLAESGTVRMAFQQTFWAYRFGMLVDQYGIPWMVSCELDKA